MNNSPRMSVETSRELFLTLMRSGVDANALSLQSGIDWRSLKQSEQRFPVIMHLKIWQAADKLLPSSGIGIKMGAHSDPYNRGIVGLVFAASPNLKVAVTNKLQYTKILAEHIDLYAEYNETDFAINYAIKAEFFHSYEIERVFSGFLSWVRIFVGRKIYPKLITYQYAEPDHVSQYKKHFNCPLFFNQTSNRIVFDKALLDTVNSQFNDYLYLILQARADKVLASLDNSVDFIEGIRSMISGRLAKGDFSADALAGSLNMSKRTFYRKLQEHDYSYQGILDNERKKMAMSYLRQTDCQLQNIAFLLGYADNKGFSRAFKRWTNYTPVEYQSQSH